MILLLLSSCVQKAPEDAGHSTDTVETGHGSESAETAGSGGGDSGETSDSGGWACAVDVPPKSRLIWMAHSVSKPVQPELAVSLLGSASDWEAWVSGNGWAHSDPDTVNWSTEWVLAAVLATHDYYPAFGLESLTWDKSVISTVWCMVPPEFPPDNGAINLAAYAVPAKGLPAKLVGELHIVESSQ